MELLDDVHHLLVPLHIYLGQYLAATRHDIARHNILVYIIIGITEHVTYIYIEREGGGDIYVYRYIYIYIHIYTQKCIYIYIYVCAVYIYMPLHYVYI